jgi:hypothetical protein
MTKKNAYHSAAARLHRMTLCVTLAVIGGSSIFLLTAVLLLKGGDSVGPHLALLGQFFPGYTVSWIGSLVGFLWGALLGGILGFIFGSVYNRVVDLRNGDKC